LNLNFYKIRERIAVSIFFFISGFTFSTWASRIPEIQNTLKLNDAELGGILILLPIGVVVTMPIAALLLSNFSSRIIMLIASIFYVLLLNLLGFSNQVWEISVIIFLFGAARNLFNISINTQAVGVQNAYFKPILASFHGVWSIAGLAGAGVASILISNEIKLNTHFYFVTLFSFFLITGAYQFTHREAFKKEHKKFVFIFPDRSLIRLGLIAFFSMVCEATISEWGVIYFIKIVHAPKTFITIGYISYLTSMTLGRFVGDGITRKYGTKLHLKIASLFVIVGIGITLMYPNIIISSIGYFLTGFGISCIMPIVFSLAGINTKLATGPAITSITTIGYLGFLTGPPLIGYISFILNIRLAFIILIIAAICINFLSSRIKT
jgi:MFS family permease